MLTDLSLDDFLERLASAAPTPGGGGAAALSGALGAALVSMVCGLTLGKEKYADFQSLASDSMARAGELRRSLLEGVTRDADAYSRVILALRMPKGSDAEREARRVALQDAYRAAADSPGEIAENCLAVMRLAGALVGRSNPNAASDLSIGALQAHAGLVGALENVAVNLSFIQDPGYVADRREWSGRALREGEDLLREVRAGVAGTRG